MILKTLKNNTVRAVTLQLVLLATVILFTSCKNSLDEISGKQKIILMGINDFHGAIKSQTKKVPKSTDALKDAYLEYDVGGAAMLSTHIKEHRKRYGTNYILLDAGDTFQGTLESNLNEGAAMIQLFNYFQVNAAVIGNHEFDYGPIGPEGTPGDKLGSLKKRLAEANYPYLTSNILDKNTKKPIEFQNLKTRTIINANNLKVGIIGLTTLQTPKSTRPEYVKDLIFTDLGESVQREAKLLRDEGANIIVLLAHAGLECVTDNTTFKRKLRRPSDPQTNCYEDGEIVTLINSLPDNTVDAVLTGHTHQIVHHWIKNIPVIQSYAYGKFYHLIHITYDWKHKSILKEQTVIEGPIQICSKEFYSDGNCMEESRPDNEYNQLVAAKLYNSTVKPDKNIYDFLKPFLEKVGDVEKEIIGNLTEKLTHDRLGGSQLGYCITDAMRMATKTKFALMNSGGIRRDWEPGQITYGELYQTLPFDNYISKLTLTGQELKLVLRVAQSGVHGVMPISGLRLTLIPQEKPAESRDLDGDGKIEAWETNRLLNVREENGEWIENSKFYTIAVPDFLVQGGDHMGWAMSKIPKERITMNTGIFIRDAVKLLLSKNTPLTRCEIDGKPRITFSESK